MSTFLRYLFIFCLTMVFASPAYASELTRDKQIEDFNKKTGVQMLGAVNIGEKEYNLVLVDGNALEQQRSIFNDLLKKNNRNGKFIACRDAIGLPVGKINGNWSYGANCLYEKGGKVTTFRVCRDEMLGRFLMEPVKPPGIYSIYSVILYTAKNCFGG